MFGATDEDALDLVHSFPLASKHVHIVSLRCSSISDRGLEALLDHLQVSTKLLLFFLMALNKRTLSTTSKLCNSIISSELLCHQKSANNFVDIEKILFCIYYPKDKNIKCCLLLKQFFS